MVSYFRMTICYKYMTKCQHIIDCIDCYADLYTTIKSIKYFSDPTTYSNQLNICALFRKEIDSKILKLNLYHTVT